MKHFYNNIQKYAAQETVSRTWCQSGLTSLSVFLFRFEVGLPVGCEVVFMKVCAESRNTASSDWMSPSLFTMPCGDAPPRHCSGIHGTCSGRSIVFPVLFILLQILSC